MRSTIERRHDRYEFLYMYREEFTAIKELSIKDSRVIAFVETYARPLLTYHVKTNYVDIFLTLRRDYIKLFKPTD